MPKRNDIQTVLIIGAGPIVIGQACEFDYSGVQACKALREEGYRVVLINSNPATIMTDPASWRTSTYIEPITPQMVEKIIAKERPLVRSPICPTADHGRADRAQLREGICAAIWCAWRKYNVELIGATLGSHQQGRRPPAFQQMPWRKSAWNARRVRASPTRMEEAKALVQKRIGLPAVIRPSFTMGGTGGGIAYNHEEFETDCGERGLDASPTTEVLIG